MGPIEAHMALHIALMNLVAPALAFFASMLRKNLLGPAGRFIFSAAFFQTAAMWAWHAPPLLRAALPSHGLHLAMQASLFSLAFWFWLAVFLNSGQARWKAILALLFTSKVFCLLGILLLFAPRALYGKPVVDGGSDLLADQQAAGLLMLVACPVTYVLAGLALSRRWLADIDRKGRAGHEPVFRDGLS